MSWSVRLFGREVFAIEWGDRSEDSGDRMDDLASSLDREVVHSAQSDIAEDHRDPDAEVYLRSRRVRPRVVAVGSRHQFGQRVGFGFSVNPTGSGPDSTGIAIAETSGGKLRGATPK